VKFGIWIFFENLLISFKFHQYLTWILGTLYEDVCTFMGTLYEDVCTFMGTLYEDVCKFMDTLYEDVCTFMGTLYEDVCIFMGTLYEDVCTFMTVFRSVLLRVINVPCQIVQKIKTHILYAITFS
jgi:hypothetical protein